MNIVVINGRFTKDPELRTSNGGKSYCAFTLAVNEFSGGNEYTQFVSCIAWEKRAENIVAFQKKGSLVLIEGSLKTNSKLIDGKSFKDTFVNVKNIQFLSPPKNESNIQQDMNNNQEFELIEEINSNNDDSILWDD